MVQGGKPLHDGDADGATNQNEAKHHVPSYRPADYPGLLLFPLEVATHQVQGPVDQNRENEYLNTCSSYSLTNSIPSIY